jgi:periplasmic divalent cation tolerance protein
MSEIVLALTTVPSDFDAATLARELVEQRLVACVSILPGIHSVYAWDDGVQDSAEQQLILKTTRDRLAELWAVLEAQHPYELGEFLVCQVVAGSPDYMKWLRESVAEPSA